MTWPPNSRAGVKVKRVLDDAGARHKLDVSLDEIMRKARVSRPTAVKWRDAYAEHVLNGDDDPPDRPDPAGDPDDEGDVHDYRELVPDEPEPEPEPEPTPAEEEPAVPQHIEVIF